MINRELSNWEHLFEQKIAPIATADDPAHDLLHFKRVVKNAKHICAAENGDINVVLPAAWLHDLVNVPKNDPRRSQASRMSADEAIEFLISINYPAQHHAAIAHAIEAHSFSANIETKTLEAQIVQDADRLDALGAVGTARCFASAGILKRPLYAEDDPFCARRAPEDLKYTVDHFYQKLFKVAAMLKTAAGRAEGERRVKFMRQFLDEMAREI